MTARQRVCLWALENLPDSNKERREVLIGIIEILPKSDDEVRAKAFYLLTLMDTFDAEQKQLPLISGLVSGNNIKHRKGDGQ